MRAFVTYTKHPAEQSYRIPFAMRAFVTYTRQFYRMPAAFLFLSLI